MPKYDLAFNPPLMNAAGTLGFSPDVHGPVDLGQLGAFLTNPISLGVRTPASGRRYRAFPGGFLLHTGYPNPGIKSVIRRYVERWARSPLPVIVHLLGGKPEEISILTRRLEGLEGVAGVEIGLPEDIDLKTAMEMVNAGMGELPLLVRLPLERASELGGACVNAGAVAVSLAPPRGTLPGNQGGFIHGRLYGPGIYPLALEMVRRLAQGGLPVIGAGGVYYPEQADAMLAAGAIAVQLDAVLWKRAW